MHKDPEKILLKSLNLILERLINFKNYSELYLNRLKSNFRKTSVVAQKLTVGNSSQHLLSMCTELIKLIISFSIKYIIQL